MSNEAIAIQHSGASQDAPRVRRGEQVARVIAFGLGVVFLWAAFWKAVDPRGTVAVFEFVLTNDSFATAAAHGLVYFEVILGVALLLGVRVSTSLAVAAGALIAFSAWTTTAWALSFDVGCGCALRGDGTPADRVGLLDVLRTVGLTTAALGGLILVRRTRSATRPVG
ncbi:MAG: MauE/DoxX family redox-associated membrane protein [Phycisphaerales bacterium]